MKSNSKEIKVAVIGTRGVPASYGGFESLVENLLGDNCPSDIRYTVFCSRPDQPEHPADYRGAALKYVPLRANGVQSIPYDMLSMARCLSGYDVILVLGVSGCLALPLLRRLTKAQIIVNIDGLEHKRDKWGTTARRILRASERAAVKAADVIVADNEGIAEYVRASYHIEPVVIAYGGDQAVRSLTDDATETTLARYGVSRRGYAMGVCRIEPENNCHLVLEAFAASDMPLVMVGNWDHSEYSRELRRRYSSSPSLILADAEYDLDRLWALRSNAALYVHGHCAGGTNPSLVEAMHTGVPIAAFDVNYNRFTTGDAAVYFRDAESLRAIIARVASLDGSRLREIARERYTWREIARQYTDLFRRDGARRCRYRARR